VTAMDQGGLLRGSSLAAPVGHRNLDPQMIDVMYQEYLAEYRRSRPPTRPAIRFRAALAVAIIVVAGVIICGSLLSPWVEELASDLGQAAAAVLAAVACWYMSSRRPDAAGRRQRNGWRLLAAGTASWAAGQGYWTWSEVIRGHDTPFPSWADAGYLPAALLVMAGLMSFYSPRPLLSVRVVHQVLEGLLLAFALLAVAWVLVLGAVLSGDGGFGEKALSMFYPIADIVNASIIVTAAARSRNWLTGPTALLAAAVLSLTVTDSLFMYLQQDGSYLTGLPFDLGWITSFLVIGLAAFAPGGMSRPRLVQLNRYVPLASLALAGLALAGQYVRYGWLGHWVPGIVGVVVGLALVRAILLVVVDAVLADVNQKVEQTREAVKDAFKANVQATGGQDPEIARLEAAVRVWVAMDTLTLSLTQEPLGTGKRPPLAAPRPMVVPAAGPRRLH
jgi:hypothetical protein